MTATQPLPDPASAAGPDRWTCPFCALLCDELPRPGPDRGVLQATDCPRARAAWAAHGAPGSGAWVAGQPTDATQAVQAAAAQLGAARQLLLGGCATDVAGARVLYRLAARCHAIADHADGAALTEGLRALQDRGQTIATLGELQARAHTLVCVGTTAVARFPRLFERIGAARAGSPLQRTVFLGVPVPPGVAGEGIDGSGDLLADVQQLAALVAGARVREPAPALVALATQLQASPYAVLLWEGAALPPHGALLVEALNRIAATLNLKTRAATFALGGNDGAASVNQTFAWLSGLPLRTRVSTQGLQHEPLRFATERLLAHGGADALLWLHSFDPARLPPATALPRVVLGPPALGQRLLDAGDTARTVFLPVATPGLNAAGHLFRTDGPVLLSLGPARDDALPSAAQVLQQLLEALP